MTFAENLHLLTRNVNQLNGLVHKHFFIQKYIKTRPKGILKSTVIWSFFYSVTFNLGLGKLKYPFHSPFLQTGEICIYFEIILLENYANFNGGVFLFSERWQRAKGRHQSYNNLAKQFFWYVVIIICYINLYKVISWEIRASTTPANPDVFVFRCFVKFPTPGGI